RYFRLLVTLEEFALGRGGTRSTAGISAARELISVVGRRAIREALRWLLARGRKMGTKPSDDDLHALRIRAKRLRYVVEFLRELTGKPGRRLIEHMVRLQDLLGAHQDAVVAVGFIRRYIEEPGRESSPEALLSLGAFMAEHQRRADLARTNF